MNRNRNTSFKSGVTEEQKLLCSPMNFVCVIYFCSLQTSLKFGDRLRDKLKDTFVAPSSSSEWRTVTKSGKGKTCSHFLFSYLLFLLQVVDTYSLFFVVTGSLRTEQSVTISKASRRQVCMDHPPHDTHKANGHSVNLPSASTPKPSPSPRLGRSLYHRPHRLN